MRKFFIVIAVVVCALSVVQAGDPQLAGRPAKEWAERLERPERVQNLKVDEIITTLALKPGQVVADLGSGPGIFTLPLAKAVGEKGTVYAVEIDQGFLDMISERAKGQQIANVKTVLGKYEDPVLPAKVDVAFFHDVLHHIEKRQEYVKAVASYLKPDGVIVLIDLDPNDPNTSHKGEPHLQVTREQANEMMAAAGLKPVAEHKLFTDKYFIVYGRRMAGRDHEHQ